MKKILLLALLVASPAVAQSPSPIDGDWKGRSDGGSCGAPLDYAINIEDGLVEGSATDTSAHGPVPNTKRTPPPAPGPGLWQLHGAARGSTFSLLAAASVKGEDQRKGKFTVTVQGSTLVVTESGGCGRTARLSKN
jgi:hypothetical protein